MDSKQRIDLTRFIWMSLMFAVIAVTVFADLGGVVVPVLIFLLGAGVLVTGFIWNWGDGSLNGKKISTGDISDEFFSKRKRDDLDVMLRNLSDEELLRLRRRLSDGDLTEQMIYEELLSEDGKYKAKR